MDNEILDLFLNVSVEVVIMSACVWLITMFLKIPIKKLTAKMEDTKRKMVNSVILFYYILMLVL